MEGVDGGDGEIVVDGMNLRCKYFLEIKLEEFGSVLVVVVFFNYVLMENFSY